MDKSKEILSEAGALVSKNFELIIKENITETTLLQALTQTIALMLDTATERLFALLYQLDVSERKVMEACANATSTQERAAIIAQLVWQREKQKAMTRLEYKKKPQRIDEDDAEAW